VYLKTIICLLISCLFNSYVHSAQWITFNGARGVGLGKHIVLVSGDEEYRSEEAMPMLGKLLADKFGFKCTVLFAIDKQTGAINPNTLENIPGLSALETADLMILFTRFRNLPDAQMQFIDQYVQSGKPILGLRPSVVAFKTKPDHTFFKYSCRKVGDQVLAQGFGLDILGADWISHHGKHKVESTLGIPNSSMRDHPILRGVEKMWGPTDVYTVNDSMDKNVLVHGQVLTGMKDTNYATKKQMPLAWTKQYQSANGLARVFMSTMGDAQDFQDEQFRRLIVNAALWCTHLGAHIPAKTDVSLNTDYTPSACGMNTFTKGVFPEDFIQTPSTLTIRKNDRICFVGNALGERAQHFGYFETLLLTRFANHNLFMRNLCRSGDEVKIRIRPDAKHYPTPADFLTRYSANIVFGFFGFNESYQGAKGLQTFENELDTWIHTTLNPQDTLQNKKIVATLKSDHNASNRIDQSRQIVLVSPIPIEDQAHPLRPNGKTQNQQIVAYKAVLNKVANKYQHVVFADVYHAMHSAMKGQTLTINGIHLNEAGYQVLATALDNALLDTQGSIASNNHALRKEVL